LQAWALVKDEQPPRLNETQPLTLFYHAGKDYLIGSVTECLHTAR
jgi:hypothetical protein